MRTRPRLISGVAALLAMGITLSAATAWADDELEDSLDPTACGAGVLNPCGSKPITKCEYDVSINLNLFSRDFGFHFKESNCVVIGSIPLYKDREGVTIQPSPTDCLPTGPIWKCR